jgi:hypothetical protein
MTHSFPIRGLSFLLLPAISFLSARCASRGDQTPLCRGYPSGGVCTETLSRARKVPVTARVSRVHPPRDAPVAEVVPRGHAMLSLFLARDQKYLCLMKTGEPRRMLSSQITDECHLVSYPVGSPATLVLLAGLQSERKRLSVDA